MIQRLNDLLVHLTEEPARLSAVILFFALFSVMGIIIYSVVLETNRSELSCKQLEMLARSPGYTLPPEERKYFRKCILDGEVEP